MIIDANNGAVMHSDQADEPRYPASLTKIMTLYLAFEAIEQGRASYATRIKITHEAASAPPTKLDLDPGETIALGDAMKALITKSANDAAVAIAEHFGGTEARFARQMTDKARLFGMSRTTFRNASGLPDPGQLTTARDMVRLALRIQDDFPQHYRLFSLRSFAYDGSSYRNHNNLLYRFQGTDGIKTGYTRASGFNLVSSVRRGGRHVVGAIFGGRTAARRDDTMQLLLARALNHSSPYKTRRSAPVLVAAPSERARPQQVAAARVPEPAPRIDSDAERPRPV
ncbi:MAG: D-alanyl-D-alanine carboxypeptidase family protein, partial [Hyphomicrobium sp.]